MPQNFLPAEMVALPQNKSETVIPNFLTIAELVEAIKISRQTISRKIKTGEIPNVKVGTRILIPTSYLFDLEKDAWSIKNHKVG